jgi:hypothetical protein
MEDNSASFLQICQIELKVALYPGETNDPILSIENYFNEKLLKYNDRMQGIPISYMDLQIPPNKNYGKIYYDQQWVHVTVSGKMLLFSPKTGESIIGKVTLVSYARIFFPTFSIKLLYFL